VSMHLISEFTFIGCFVDVIDGAAVDSVDSVDEDEKVDVVTVVTVVRVVVFDMVHVDSVNSDGVIDSGDVDSVVEGVVWLHFLSVLCSIRE
jgi:hypothetical protein